MKTNTTKLFVYTFALCTLLLTGCKSPLSPLVTRQGVAIGVSYSVMKYPSAVPYLKAVTPVVCASANSTNLSPAAVVAAIEQSSAANALKTPEGVLILNSSLLLYNAVWQSFGSNAVANIPTLREHLQATCNGLNDGLFATTATAAAKGNNAWARVKF